MPYSHFCYPGDVRGVVDSDATFCSCLYWCLVLNGLTEECHGALESSRKGPFVSTIKHYKPLRPKIHKKGFVIMEPQGVQY